MRQAWGVQKNEAVESLRVRQAHRRRLRTLGDDGIARRCHSERWIVHERWNVCVHRRRAGLKAIHVDMSAENDADRCRARCSASSTKRALEKISCGREAPYAPAERRAFTKASNRLFDAIKKCTGLRVLNLTNCGEDVRFPLLSCEARRAAFERTQAQPHGRRTRMARRRTRGR